MKVKIRTWDSMEKEFGIETDSINCTYSFTENMKYLCGKKIKIKWVAGYGAWTTADSHRWSISEDMVTKKYKKKYKKKLEKHI